MSKKVNSIDKKEITLEYNGYTIGITIKKDYASAIKTIKEKLYFTDEDFNNCSLSYKDDDGDDNPINDENDFEGALGNEVWGLTKIEIPHSGDNIGQQQINKITEKTQKEINEKVNKIKDKLIQKFTELTKQKIAANNSKYEERIKKLEAINKSNESALKELKEMHISSLQNIINDFSECSKQKLEKELEEYNKEVKVLVDSQLKVAGNETEKAENGLNQNIEDLNTIYDQIKTGLENSMSNFKTFYSSFENANNNH